jgi:hypothetical protein
MNDAEGSIVVQAVEILVRAMEAGKRESIDGEFVVNGKKYELHLEKEADNE